MGFFRKSMPASPVVDRYAGKPFLRLVDAFVLDCIGELDAGQRRLLESMTPKLQQTFNHSGRWDEIVMAQLQWTDAIRPTVRDLWKRNQAIAKDAGTALSAVQFAHMFVDKNVMDGA